MALREVSQKRVLPLLAQFTRGLSASAMPEQVRWDSAREKIGVVGCEEPSPAFAGLA